MKAKNYSLAMIERLEVFWSANRLFSIHHSMCQSRIYGLGHGGAAVLLPGFAITW